MCLLQRVTDASFASLSNESLIMNTAVLDSTLTAGTTVAPTASHDNKFAALLKTLGNVPKPSRTGKTLIQPATVARMRKIAPELVDDMLDSKGNPYHGAILYVGKGLDVDGCVKDNIYIVRIVTFEPRDAAYILKELGEGNRDPIPARQKEIIRKQKEGEWQFVGNTIVITIEEPGMIKSSMMEQHNAGHSCRAQLESGKTLTYVLIIGIPKSERDKIDDNAARSAKDIASTRSELKEFFAVGTVIGGAVTLTEPLSKKCKSCLTEALRIVDDQRHGLPAKSGGARDKVDVGEKLDLYGNPLSQAVGLVVALDSKSPTTGKEGKVKANGAFTKRVPLNHAVAMLTLAASDRDANTGIITFNEDASWSVMEFYTLIAAEAIDDDTMPAVAFRNTIDRWNATKKHDGSDGKNVRFAALKKAYIDHVNETEVRGETPYDYIVGGDVVFPEFQIGGIDDFVKSDDLAKRMASMSAPAKTDEPLPLIPEDEMTEESSDVPSEIDE